MGLENLLQILMPILLALILPLLQIIHLPEQGDFQPGGPVVTSRVAREQAALAVAVVVVTLLAQLPQSHSVQAAAVAVRAPPMAATASKV